MKYQTKYQKGEHHATLHELLLLCFQTGLATTLWVRDVIVRIAQGADKEPCAALNKVYCGVGVLNNILVKCFDFDRCICERTKLFHK